MSKKKGKEQFMRMKGKMLTNKALKDGVKSVLRCHKDSEMASPMSTHQGRCLRQKSSSVSKSRSGVLEICNTGVEDWKKSAVSDAISFWLSQLRPSTQDTYATCMTKLIELELIPVKRASRKPFSIEEFNERPHETVIDVIKKLDKLSEASRQKYAAAYISFTRFLERLTEGWFRRALPARTGSNRTFYPVREKAKTKTLNLDERYRFLTELEAMNERDVIIAKCLLQGAKRISEVLDLKTDCIDWDKQQILFRQRKTRGVIKEIVVNFPKSFMAVLKDYIESTEDARGKSKTVFITRSGKGVLRNRLNQVFKLAGKRAGLKVRVTPHTLRATTITTAKREGVADSSIMTVTGHCSAKMVVYYDKNAEENNFTKKINMI